MLTPDDLHALAARHTPDPDLPDTCAECDAAYPCPTKRLILALAEETARRRYAEHHARGALNYTPWPDLTKAARLHWIGQMSPTAAPARGVKIIPFIKPGGRHTGKRRS